MSEVACQSEVQHPKNTDRLESVRANAGAELSLYERDGNTIVDSIYEYGGVRVRFPRTPPVDSNGRSQAEAILINTAGGLAGGDQVDYRISLGKEARFSLTTQALERIYRSIGSASTLNIKLQLGARSRLFWIPQGTLFYSGARLRRSIDVDLHRTSEILIAESMIFGRQGMGETNLTGAIRDDWRVRRDGKLIFADSFKLVGKISEQLLRPAIGNRAHCMATLLFVSSEAEGKIELVRRALSSTTTAWGSSWWNGIMCVRLLSSQSDRLLADIACVVEILTERPIPRIWRT